MDRRIDEIQMDDGEYFVYLKKGWRIANGSPGNPQHCFGEPTKKGIRQQMKDIEKCDCETCK